MTTDIEIKENPRKRRGSGRATIHDVARQAGVGSITVSRYLKQPDQVSAELSARIVAAIKQLNYVPNLVAGGLASTRGRIIGMVIPNISGPIFANTIQGFSDVLTRYGYQLLLASSSFSVEQEEDTVRAFLGWSPAIPHQSYRKTGQRGRHSDCRNLGLPAAPQTDSGRFFTCRSRTSGGRLSVRSGLSPDCLRAEQHQR